MLSLIEFSFLMPKFFLYLGYWVGRFSDEESRAHVHVVKFGSSESMKVWLEPEVELEYRHGINVTTANKIVLEIRRRRDECLSKWYGFDGESR